MTLNSCVSPVAEPCAGSYFSTKRKPSSFFLLAVSMLISFPESEGGGQPAHVFVRGSRNPKEGFTGQLLGEEAGNKNPSGTRASEQNATRRANAIWPSPFVIGGKEAREFPFYGFWQGCGSTLIDPEFALSAAHCGYFPRLGDPLEFDGGRATREVIDWRIHPQYDEGEGFSPNDFLVIRLSEPITHIEPVLINNKSANPSSGDYLRVVGRGVTDPWEGELSPILMEAEAPFIPYSECSAFFDSSSLVDEIMICSGGSGEVSCGGDSGGPILDSRGTQVGVVSWGRRGCPEDVPSVSARVSAAFDWIHEQFCDMEPTHCATDPPSPSSEPTPEAGPTPEPTPEAGPAPEPEPEPEQSTASCDDDREAKFDVFGISRKCNWLSRRVDQLVRATSAYRQIVNEETLSLTWRQALCNSGQEAYTYCEETCGVCQDTCIDDDAVTAAFQVGQGRNRTCRWLRRKKAGTINRICRDTDARSVCRETCDAC